MNRWLLAIVVVLTIASCRDDGPPEEEMDVRQAADELLLRVWAGRYEEVWESLHRAHQAIVPREQLVDCGNRFPPAFQSHEIDRVSEEAIAPDEIGETDGWAVAVTFELTDEFAAPNSSSTPIDRQLHFVEVDGTWRWVLGTGELQTFREGNCGLPWPGGSQS